MATQTQCTACKATIPAASAFCAVCGAQQPPRCANCGAPLLPEAAFCSTCGAAVVSTPAQPTIAPSICTNCGTELPTGAAFCSNCGTAVCAASAPPRPTTSCPKCDTPLREGARFCRKCGFPVAGEEHTVTGASAPASTRADAPATAAAGQRPQRSAQNVIDQLTWSSIAAGIGFIVAAISPFLTWASASGFSVSPFDANARFRLGDALKSDSIDGPATVLVAIAGFAVLLTFLLGRLEMSKGKYWIAGIGAALAALGVIEIQFVASRPGSIDIGFGLYLLVAGGLLAAASPWIPDTRVRR